MNLIERSPLLSSLNYAKGQALYRLGVRGHHSGATALAKSVDEAVRYIRDVVADYIVYGADGDPERIRGKDILEVGPGDNLGVGLMLLAGGARSVTCVDGFVPRADPAHNRRVYAAIFESLSGAERDRVRDVISLQPDGSAALNQGRLLARYDVPVDTDPAPLESGRYDIVVSRAVLEHLGDLDAGWRTMVRCLRPEGEMWHKVDFRCHKFFEKIHPLRFLTVPETPWRLMSRPDPTLNRLRLPSYREMSARDFASARLYITHIIEEREFSPHVEKLEPGLHYSGRHLDLVRRIRPQLQEPFRFYGDEDLLVTGVFLSARGVRR